MRQQRPIRYILDDLIEISGGTSLNHSGYRMKAISLIGELENRHPEMHKYTHKLKRLFTEHFSSKRHTHPIAVEVRETSARIRMLESSAINSTH